MILRPLLVPALLAAAWAAPAGAQVNFCTPQGVQLVAGRPAAAPAGRTQLSLVDAAGAPVTSGFAAKSSIDSTWTPSAADVAALRAAQQGAPVSLFLRWLDPEGGDACLQGFTFQADGGGNTGTTGGGGPSIVLPEPEDNRAASATGWDEGDCAAAGQRWRSEIRRQVGSDRFTEVVFLENAGVCYRSRDYGVVGDPIYVGVFTDEPKSWDGVGVEFDPCAIEDAAPSVLVTDRTSVLGGLQSAVVAWRLITYPQRTCYNESVSVTVNGNVNGTEVAARTTLEQARRYRATLHAGTLFTNVHDRSFGLRPDSAGGQRIYGQGPDNQGPEYYAAVVLYALPRYLPSLFGGERYAGRDVVHDQALADRIGGILGVGISNPRNQFVAGLSAELLAGVNLTGTWYFSRVTRLAGVAEGALFTGTAEEVPERDVWKDDFTFGLSLDLRYVSALLSR